MDKSEFKSIENMATIENLHDDELYGFLSPLSKNFPSNRGEKSEEDEATKKGCIFIKALSQKNEEVIPIESEIPSIIEPESRMMTKPKLALQHNPVFASDVGQSHGIKVFRIENFSPIEQENSDSFCIADAYIILHSNKPHPDSTLVNTIYTWIGSESEADKRFCCAMYAVSLRNQLDTTTPIHRQIETEESEEFLSIFPDFEITCASNGTESGLYMPLEFKQTQKLYKIQGKKNIDLILVF
jgi:hypothetical protein